jgi:TusA-related sulfurtransferase
MKFVENVKPDISTDIVFMMCPMHLLKLDEQIKELQQGQILEIITDYDGALEDIPGWCDKTGNEFIGLEDTGDFYKFYIKKVAR